MPDEPFFLEALPDEVQATLEARDHALDALGNTVGGLEFIVDNLRRWLPGSTVRVAFLSGSAELHRDIAEVAGEINEHCNLTLDFGFDEATETYRSWSPTDAEHAAEIRVSFDQRGFFSLVGNDSISPSIGVPGAAVGGRAGQRSLNLGGFELLRPSTWRGTVVHEFLHAVGFEHEHVNLRGPCQQAFRFEDDPGYTPTQDFRGVFISDFAGRRPGIYTYLSGAPNHWPRAKVDHNLRPSGGTGVIEGPFDRSSAMLYRFPELFYRTPNSGCAPDGDGQQLSPGDVAGLQTLYPFDDDDISELVNRKQSTLAGLSAEVDRAAPAADVALEAADDGGGAGLHALRGPLETLRQQLGDAGR